MGGVSGCQLFIFLTIRQMRVVTILVSIVFFSMHLRAQDFSSYSNLESTGTLSKEFSATNFIDFNAAKGKAAFELPREERLIELQYYQQSDYWQYQMHFGGLILFDEEINSYIRDVAAKVLHDAPDLLKKLNFYVLRSSSLNAFASGNGNIYINMGLLARLENEAQLAYILSHEIIHYVEEHGIEGFVTSEKIRGRIGNYGNSQIEKEIVDSHKYRQSQEYEADTLGLDYFEESGYSLSSAVSTFDLLDKAQHPLGDVQIPDTYISDMWLDWVRENEPDTDTAIVSLDDTVVTIEKEIIKIADEKNSTHPSVEDRRNKINELLKGKPLNAGEDFLVSKTRFDKIRETARFELGRTLLNQGQYISALYHSYLMSQTYPNHPYWQNITANALTAIATLKSGENGSDKFFEGDTLGQVKSFNNYMLEQPVGEISTAAFIYTMNLGKEKLGEQEYDKLMRTGTRNLLTNHGRLLLLDSAFSFSGNETWMRGAWGVEPFPVKNELLKQEEVVKYLAVELKECKRKSENHGKFDKLSKAEKKRIQKEFDRSYKLDNKKVVIMDPVSLVIDPRQDYPLSLKQSESARIKTVVFLNRQMEKYNGDIKHISPHQMNAGDVDAYNDLVLMKDWISDFMLFGDRSFTTLPEEKTNAFISKYQTSYVLWSGAITVLEPVDGLEYLLFSVFFFPAAPFLLERLVNGKPQTYFFSILLDIKNGRVINAVDDYLEKTSNTLAIKKKLTKEFKRILN
jgi:Zn-dependent protease with chaperone function